jgi:hypothetical protein
VNHPSPRCVVELRTVKPDQAGVERAGIGSGYLVAAGWVLTAAHVVDGATSVRAWVDPPSTLTVEGEASVDPTGILRLRGADWALVPLRGNVAPDGFAPAVFGRLDRDSIEAVPTVAMGLPWYRLRDTPLVPGIAKPAASAARLREVLAAGGHIIPAGGGKTGVLTMIVTGAPDAATQSAEEDPTTGVRTAETSQKRSVWEGMSGSAVWAGRILIGIVVRHEIFEGPAALSVDPVPGPGEVEASLIMPGITDPVTVRAPAGQLEHTYRQVAADLAPAVLSGRAEETAAMDEFAAGSTRWWWWSADAFAGKTALTAWWVAYRDDPDAAVVACFLSRTARHDTADYLVRSWAKQLGAVTGDADLWQLGQLTADPEGRAQLTTLIDQAARQLKRLILVVDGLDEHATTGSVPVRDWLPKPERLPANAALLVTSRAGAPHGIPAGHPLHEHVHRLEPSPVADKIRNLAEAEIQYAVEQPAATRERRILSNLAAAAAPLTINELTALINLEGGRFGPSDIDVVWQANLSRTLTRKPSGKGELSFSHDALRVSARDRLAEDLPMCRAVLDGWVDQYAARRWPSDTPAYMLDGYPAMLAVENDADRLYEIVTTPGRFMGLFLHDGSPMPGNAELHHAQHSIAQRGDLDQRSELRILTLGLFRSPVRQAVTAAARSAVAVWSVCGDYDRAVRLAREIREPDARSAALVDIALAAAANEDTGWAHQLFDDAMTTAPSSGLYHDPILVDLATRLSTMGVHAMAEAAAEKIKNPLGRLSCLARMSRAAAQRHQNQAARTLASRVLELAADPSYPDRHRPLSVLAETLMILGDDDQALRVLDRAEELTASAEFSDEGKYRMWARVAVATGRYRCQAVRAARGFDDLVMAMETDRGMQEWLRRGTFFSQRASWYVANVAAALADTTGVDERTADLAGSALRQSIASANADDEEARWVESTHVDLARVLMDAGLTGPLTSALDSVVDESTMASQAWRDDCESIRAQLVRRLALDGDWSQAEQQARSINNEKFRPSPAQIAAAAAPALRGSAAWSAYQHHALTTVEDELRQAVTQDRAQRLTEAVVKVAHELESASTIPHVEQQRDEPTDSEARAEAISIMTDLAHEIAGIDVDSHEYQQLIQHIEQSFAADVAPGRPRARWITLLPDLVEESWELSEARGVHPDYWLRSVHAAARLLQRTGATDTARLLAASMLAKLQAIDHAGVLQSCIGPTLASLQATDTLTQGTADSVLATIRAATDTASPFETARIGRELAAASIGGPACLGEAAVQYLFMHGDAGGPLFANWYQAAESALCSLVEGSHAEPARRLADVLVGHATNPDTMWYDQAAIYAGIVRSEEPSTAKAALRGLAMHDAFLDFVHKLPARLLRDLVSSGAFEAPSA